MGLFADAVLKVYLSDALVQTVCTTENTPCVFFKFKTPFVKNSQHSREILGSQSAGQGTSRGPKRRLRPPPRPPEAPGSSGNKVSPPPGPVRCCAVVPLWRRGGAVGWIVSPQLRLSRMRFVPRRGPGGGAVWFARAR